MSRLLRPSSGTPHLVGGRPPTLYMMAFLTLHKALETGQLIKDPYFTLFEAVGALEVCSLCIT